MTMNKTNNNNDNISHKKTKPRNPPQPLSSPSTNLRNLDVESLQKRIRETQAQMEVARKEMEALEKRAGRKAKEAAKWRDALVREMERVV
jgi:uncharacterized small protein (DUF1192 family)